MAQIYENSDSILRLQEENLTPEALKERLADLAKQLTADISACDPEHSQEILSSFVSDLFLAATQQSMREKRRKKQAEGIAKAKARGVRFGTPRKPLPPNFEAVLQLWQNREIPLREAAKQCNMPESTFYDAAKRAAQPAE